MGDVKRIKAEPEPSGSGQQAVMDGEDFEGFAQYGDGQEFDESIAGASGSGGGDGKATKKKSKSKWAIYFEMDTYKDSAICRTCGDPIPVKHGTTGMKRHSSMKHGLLEPEPG